MTLINNIDVLFHFAQIIIQSQTRKNVFFPVMIISRKKDSGDTKDKIYARLNLYEKDLNDETKESIMHTCTKFNARAYIELNPRSDEVIAGDLLEYVAQQYRQGNYHVMRTAYDHVVGKEVRGKWFMVDIDCDADVPEGTLQEFIEEVKKAICAEYVKYAPDCMFITRVIPTKNGAHLIVPAFNKKVKLPTADAINAEVKTNAFTLLYF